MKTFVRLPFILQIKGLGLENSRLPKEKDTLMRKLKEEMRKLEVRKSQVVSNKTEQTWFLNHSVTSFCIFHFG